MIGRRAHDGEGPHGRGLCLVVAMSFAVLILVWTGSGSGPMFGGASAGSATPSWRDGLVSGVFLAGTTLAALLDRRRRTGPPSQPVLAGLLVACQGLLVTLAIVHAPPVMSVVETAPLLLLALIGAIAVTRVLTGPLRDGHPAAERDGNGLSLGMGLTAAGHLLLLPTSVPASAQAVIGVVVTTHVVAVTLVVRHRTVSAPSVALLIATVLTFATALGLAEAGLVGSAWGPLMAVAQAAVGAAWLGVAWMTLQRQADEERRRLNEMNDTLLKTARDQRERLHELRSTVAGLVTGSALLDRSELPAETRQHLWESVCRELERMERLLSDQDDPPTDLDLDQTLGLILDLQRLKGRRVEFHSSGDSVRARYDALAEVVNILLDNAVTHGGSESSVVEVARRDDEVVDITVTDFGRGIPQEQRAHIFEWGRRGTDSPGEGIGLHVAQRLIAENGGSLRCAEPTSGAGTSFVISLPAARVSTENYSTSDATLHTTDKDRHVASRRTG